MAGKFLTDADVAPLFPGAYAMPVPPEIEAKYGDPRLADLPDRDPDDPWANAAVYRPLPPVNPQRNTESRYVLLKTDWSAKESFEEIDWLNRPDSFQTCGGGLGFGAVPEQPLWRGIVCSEAHLPELMLTGGGEFILASPRVIALLTTFGLDQLETLEVAWSEDSDPKLRGYVMLDVRRVFQSYDYDQCEMRFHKSRGRMIGMLGGKRGFRGDIDQSIHMFHDLYDRKPFVLSRKLAHYLRDNKVRGLVVDDPASSEDAFWHEELAAGASQ